MTLVDLKEMAWQSARIVDEYNPARIRQDACGAWIAYADFNNGWELDHIYPVSRLKSLNVPEELWDHPLNIRALHWQNNLSKGNSYLMYTAVVSDEGAINIKCEAVFRLEEGLKRQFYISIRK